MPELQLANGLGELDKFSPIKMLSVMLFPNDVDRREELVAGGELWDKLGITSADSGPPARALHPKKFGGTEEGRRGAIAGSILVTVRKLDQLNDVEASLNKADSIVLAHMKSEGHSPATRKVIKAAWSDYRSVAHFWAAIHLFPSEDEFLAFERLQNPNDFRLFLGKAENMRVWGESLTSRGAITTTLRPDETWKIPAGLAALVIRIDLPPLPSSAMAALAGYSAPA